MQHTDLSTTVGQKVLDDGQITMEEDMTPIEMPDCVRPSLMAMPDRTRRLTECAVLAALITVTGTLKIPGLIPGSEFQLSAPLAVAICAAFGFTQYLLAGILSSIIGLVLSTQNLLNVFIAIIFRVTVGGILTLFGTTWPVIIIAGPIGSTLARLALGGIIGKAVVPLVVAAVPGMIYTALAAWPLTMIMKRIKSQTEKVITSVVQR
jgi:thiamine transporter ThiT